MLIYLQCDPTTHCTLQYNNTKGQVEMKYIQKGHKMVSSDDPCTEYHCDVSA